MGRALNKLFTFILAAGLVFSGPVCPHARAGMSGGAAQHESAAVPHYADLAIDPGDEECPHLAGAPAHTADHDGICQKCCAACIGAVVTAAAPSVMGQELLARDLVLAPAEILIARAVPIDPGIPKPL
jgi:hypothetical protein